MNHYEFDSSNEEETKQLARKLGSKLKPGDVITLSGELGAGKTTFTKGLAQGLGVKRAVSSPTFTIIKEYQGKLPLYHMDVYRLEHSDEDIGFDEYFYGEGVTVIEWASFIKDYLPDNYLEINIDKMNEVNRKFKLTAIGTRFANLLEELK